MIQELSTLAALALGLSASGHCLAMCGGIGAAFGLHRQSPLLALLASLGRVLTYALLGALVGLLGAGMHLGLDQSASGLWLLRGLAAASLVVLGLHLAEWSRWLDRAAVLGQPLWRRLAPFTRKLLPIDTPLKALSAGAIWGLLPCGLVYGMLVLAAGMSGPAEAALFLGAFGLGTVPAVAGAGWLLAVLPTRTPWRRALGATLCLIGVLWFVSPWFVAPGSELATLFDLADCHPLALR